MSKYTPALYGITEDVDSTLKRYHNFAFNRRDCEESLNDDTKDELYRHVLKTLLDYMEQSDDVVVGAKIKTNDGKEAGDILWQSGGYFQVRWLGDVGSFGKRVRWNDPKKPKTYDAAIEIFFSTPHIGADYQKENCTVEPIYGVIFDYYKWKGQPTEHRFKVGDKVKYVGEKRGWQTAKGAIWTIVKAYTKKGAHLYTASNEKAGTLTDFTESDFEAATPDEIANAPQLLTPGELAAKRMAEINRSMYHKYKVGDKVRFQKYTFKDGSQFYVGTIVDIDYTINQYIIQDEKDRSIKYHVNEAEIDELLDEYTDRAKQLKLLKLKSKAAKAKLALMKIDGLAGLGWPHFPFVLAIKEFRSAKKQPVNLWITNDNAAVLFVKKKEQKSYPATSNEYLYQQLLRLCRERDILTHWYNCKVSPQAYDFAEHVYSVGTYSTDLKTEYEAGSVEWFTKQRFDTMTVKEIETKLDELETEIKEYVQKIKEDNSTIERLKEGSYWREQYDTIKSKHPDAILLFRVGDFYEAYYNDAKEIAPILDITLTTAGDSKMAGFPAYAIDTYLPKLVRAGKRVAVCDNIIDNKLVKKGAGNLNLLKLKAKAAKAKLALMQLDGFDLGMAVHHNSPYLLKRADGSFIDPETGECLGFDHRFMASGEGCQSHGWGSYFSENDRRNYANNQRNPNKYKGVTSDEIDKLNLERTERVIAMCILGDMDLYPQRTVEELIQEYIRDIKINTALVEKKLALLLKIKNIGDDSVKYWNKSVERQKLCEKIDKILGDSEAGRNVYMNIASSLRYDRMAFSRIINEYETTCDSVCVENEEELAAFERLNPDDFERVEKERHHYEVEIPDNDGTNYIEEQKNLTDKQIQMVLDGLSRWKVIDVRTNDWLKPYTNPDGKPYSYLRGGNWKGENLYKEFCAAFDYEHNYRAMKPADAGRRASQFLHDCGFVGIHYSSYSDGECYVIFDENDAKITSHNLFGPETNK